MALRASRFPQLLLPGLGVQLQAVLVPRQLCWEVWAAAGSPPLWELLFGGHSQAWLRPELQHRLCRNQGCAWPWAQLIQTWTETWTDCPASPQTCLFTMDLAGSHWEISDLGQHHQTRPWPRFTTRVPSVAHGLVLLCLTLQALLAPSNPGIL